MSTADGRVSPITATEMIFAFADRIPDAVAIEAPEGHVSYAELVSRADAMAALLGAVEGGLVSIGLPRSADRIVAMLAAWRAGAGYLPLDPAWPEARQKAFAADAGCAALIAEPALGARIAGTIPLVAPDAPNEGGTPAPHPADPDRLAYAIYTSGSTGAPKAVEITQGNLAALIGWHRAAFELREGTRTSHLAGLGFDAAAWEVWPTLAAGGTIVLIDDATRADPARLRDMLVAERIEIAFAPTALAQPLLTLDWPADAALRLLLTGADRLTARPPAGLPFALVNNYGPTECTVVATSGIVDPDGDGLPSIGHPIAGTAVHILRDDGTPANPGESGELWIGGAQVARGYRGDPALTATRFVDHPEHGRLYRSGDLGAWRADGAIDFHGRADAQIKIRGHRIEPAEIAAALDRLANVSASAVVAQDGELVAYVVPTPGAARSTSVLREALAETQPAAMIPARFVTLAALPLTANGKIDLAALPDPNLYAISEAARAPANPTEARLLAIVHGVIGHDDIGVEDDFFLTGGHSLLGTQVVVRAREAFGVELTLFHLFEGRTVASLAVIVERLVTAMLDAMSDEDIRAMAAR